MLVPILITCACSALAAGHTDPQAARLRSISGMTAEDRGRSLALELGESAQSLMATKIAFYSRIPGALDQWHAIANSSASAISKYAPITAAELRGAAANTLGSTAFWTLLANEYELLMWQGGDPPPASLLVGSADKCTGYAGIDSTSGISVAGQNNDENPALWHQGALDVVLRYGGGDGASGTNATSAADAPAALVYTHPGYPGYMGINANGLAVLWQYIDDGERDYTRVPTCVMIRELLAQPTLDAALALLEVARVAVPNNFILADARRVVNVEVSPARFTVLSLNQGDVVHTNHYLFDQGAIDHDVGRNHSRTTVARFEAMRAMVRQHRHRRGGAAVPPSALAEMLSTAPILRNATHGTDNATLASMVFEPARRSMRIHFKGDAWAAFQSYQI